MRGADHNSSRQVLCLNGKSNTLGRKVLPRKNNRKTVPGQNLSYKLCKFPGKEASVVPHHQPFFSLPRLVVIGHGLSYPAHIGEGEIVSNDPPPSVSTKLYLCHVLPSSAPQSSGASYVTIINRRCQEISATPALGHWRPGLGPSTDLLLWGKLQKLFG